MTPSIVSSVVRTASTWPAV